MFLMYTVTEAFNSLINEIAQDVYELYCGEVQVFLGIF
jgi:hypothetical protein